MAGKATHKADRSREEAVLQAAYAVFTRYGFERATMDDVAREAGVSRPLIYVKFRNKKDVYRALAAQMTARMLDTFEATLTGHGPIGETLAAAWQAAFIAPMAAIAETPHGLALVDMKNDLADDVFRAMRARKRAILTAYFDRVASALPSPSQSPGTGALADMMIDVFEGAKMRSATARGLVDAMRPAILLIAEKLGEKPT